MRKFVVQIPFKSLSFSVTERDYEQTDIIPIPSNSETHHFRDSINHSSLINQKQGLLAFKIVNIFPLFLQWEGIRYLYYFKKYPHL